MQRVKWLRLGKPVFMSGFAEEKPCNGLAWKGGLLQKLPDRGAAEIRFYNRRKRPLKWNASHSMQGRGGEGRGLIC